MAPNNHSSKKKHAPEVNESLEAQLRSHGFEGGEPIHEFYSCFRLNEAFAALTESTYSKPIPVYLKSEEHDVNIPVVMTMMKACYQPFAPYLDSPAGCYETPEWYFEGWILKSGFDTFSGITRVRIYVTDTDPEDPNTSVNVLWQVIPTDPDPNEPLRLV